MMETWKNEHDLTEEVSKISDNYKQVEDFSISKSKLRKDRSWFVLKNTIQTKMYQSLMSHSRIALSFALFASAKIIISFHVVNFIMNFTTKPEKLQKKLSCNCCMILLVGVIARTNE